MMKAIVMDLDNTLYDATAAYQRGEEAALRLGAEILGLPPEVWAEAWNAGKARTKELLKDCAAQHHRLFYVQHALEYLGRSPFDHTEEIYDTYRTLRFLFEDKYLGGEYDGIQTYDN